MNRPVLQGSINDNGTNDSSTTTEVTAHFCRFVNIEMQKVGTAPTAETGH